MNPTTRRAAQTAIVIGAILAAGFIVGAVLLGDGPTVEPVRAAIQGFASPFEGALDGMATANCIHVDPPQVHPWHCL